MIVRISRTWPMFTQCDEMQCAHEQRERLWHDRTEQHTTAHTKTVEIFVVTEKSISQFGVLRSSEWEWLSKSMHDSTKHRGKKKEKKKNRQKRRGVDCNTRTTCVSDGEWKAWTHGCSNEIVVFVVVVVVRCFFFCRCFCATIFPRGRHRVRWTILRLYRIHSLHLHIFLAERKEEQRCRSSIRSSVYDFATISKLNNIGVRFGIILLIKINQQKRASAHTHTHTRRPVDRTK